MHLPFDAEGPSRRATGRPSASRPSSCRCGRAAFATSACCGRWNSCRAMCSRRGVSPTSSRTDVPLPLPCGQTMTAPRTVADDAVALGLQPGQRVLEIGTGSGYVTALLAQLGAEVVSVERFNTLAESAGPASQDRRGFGQCADRDRRWSGRASARSASTGFF